MQNVEATIVNQYLIMLFAALSPVATFFVVEWRSERKQRWEAARLKAEREAASEELRLTREAERQEREAIAALVKAQLEMDAEKLRHALGSQIQNVALKNDLLHKAVQENTELTKEGASVAQAAYTEANHINMKIEAQNAIAARAAQQLEDVQRRFDALLRERSAKADIKIDTIEETTTDTNARVREMEQR
jgi:hypothetical protein